MNALHNERLVSVYLCLCFLYCERETKVGVAQRRQRRRYRSIATHASASSDRTKECVVMVDLMNCLSYAREEEG
jgi:hypothetical protein